MSNGFARADDHPSFMPDFKGNQRSVGELQFECLDYRVIRDRR
jgi:hypothetical protein